MKRHFKGSLSVFDFDIDTNIYVSYRGYYQSAKRGKTAEDSYPAEVEIELLDLPEHLEYLEGDLKDEIMLLEGI